MRAEKLLGVLRDGEIAVGAAVHFADPAVAEIAALAGFDWVSVAVEHDTITTKDVAALQLAADVRAMTLLVHVIQPDDPRILPLLNAGVGGVVLAHASSGDDVERFVHGARFPPLGDRGAHAAVRSNEYGAVAYSDYVAEVDRSVALGIVIEDVDALERAGEILAVPGIDFSYVGLQDLAQSMGRPGDLRHPEVRGAIERVVDLATPHGTHVAVSQYDYDIRDLRAMGVRMVATSMDHTALLRSFRDDVDRARAALAT
jgi:2-keto-3-deoxy-L-rhamnonate aldolase RhmA